LRKRRAELEHHAESTVGGKSDTWLRSFLIQQFLVQHANDLALTCSSSKIPPSPVSYAEVQEFWDAGLIERVEALDGSVLLFADGWDLRSARAALKVRRNLTRSP
jgi:hypothetical protein